MRTVQQTHEGPRWSYWDLQQPQCKTAILLGYSRTVLPRTGFQEPVPFCRKPSSCPPRPFPGKVKRQHGTITRIKEAIESHGNRLLLRAVPSTALCTHAYIPGEYVPQILNINDTGQKLYEDYVSERINGDVSLWAPVKKEEPDVHVWQQEAHSQGSGQDCGSKGNQSFVWALDGSCSFEQRH